MKSTFPTKTIFFTLEIIIVAILCNPTTAAAMMSALNQIYPPRYVVPRTQILMTRDREIPPTNMKS